MVFFQMSVAVPLAREGKLRALAVTSLRRSSAAPDVPTIAESRYPGFEVIGWTGMVAPAGTPAAIVRKLRTETVKVFALPDVRARFLDLGVEGVGNSPAEFAAIINSEIPNWAKVIKDSVIKQDYVRVTIPDRRRWLLGVSGAAVPHLYRVCGLSHIPRKVG